MRAAQAWHGREVVSAALPVCDAKVHAQQQAMQVLAAQHAVLVTVKALRAGRVGFKGLGQSDAGEARRGVVEGV